MICQLEDEFGDVIQKARKGQGVSLARLSEMSGVSRRELEEYEDYRGQPTKEQVVAVSGALNLDETGLWEVAQYEKVEKIRPQLGPLEMETVVYRPWRVNCYIIGNEEGEALIVDPGAASSRIIDTLEERGWCPVGVLLTHAHGDHAGDLPALLERWQLDVMFGREERKGVEKVVRGHEGDLSALPVCEDGQITVGSFDVMVQSTPGHSSGSISYTLESATFVGDCLFARSIGRPARREAFPESLASARKVLSSFEDQHVLLPGHGPYTTVGMEERRNPFRTLW